MVFLLFATIAIAYPVAIRVNANLPDFFTRINKCSDASCASLDYSSNQTINSGSATNQYSIAGPGTIYTGEYDYKACYLPHLYVVDTNDGTGAGPWDYSINFVKKAACSADINSIALSQSTINKGQPVTITANVSSAFVDPGTGPNTVPEDIKNVYSSDANVTLVVKNSSGSVVYASSSFPDIYMSSNQNVSFVYTPNLGDIYAIEIRTNATDCACSGFTERQSSTPLTVLNNIPTLGDVKESPIDPATYLKNGAYQFNVTVNDADGTVDLSTIILEWVSNQTIMDYQAINSSAREYYANINDLAAGNYNYKWFVLDSQNAGNSISNSYTVGQATPFTSLYVNQTAIERGGMVNVTALASDPVLAVSIYANYTGILETIKSGAGIQTNITDTTTLPIGLYEISANTTGNANYTDNATLETVYITVQDTQPPRWSNNITAPLPAVYSPMQDYQFNITWNGATDVILEFNGTNYSVSSDGSVYYRTFTDLPANEIGYPYKWHANDSAGNWNATAELAYVISKAPTLTRLFLNETEGNRIYATNTTANFTVSVNISGKTVYLDTNISGWVMQSGMTPLENTTNLVGEGAFNITGYFDGNENYTSSSQTYFANVQDLISPLITIESPTNQTYQTSRIDLNFTVSEPTNWIGYSLKSGTNQTINENTVLSLNQGSYDIVVYANDTSGNMNISDPVYFSVACLSNIINSTIDAIYYENNLTNVLTGASTLTCSNITNSTITNSTVNNSLIKNAVLEGMTVKDSIIDPPYIPAYAANSTVESNSNATESSVVWSNITNWSNVTWSMVNHSWIDWSNVFNSTVFYSLINQSDIRDSAINSSNVLRSSANYSTIYNSDITDSQTNNSYIDKSSIANSTVLDSNITNSNITLSDIRNSTVIDSNITNSNVTNSFVTNSTIVNSNIIDMIVYDANIADGVLYWGIITYNGVNYTAPPSVNLNDIYNPPSSPGPSGQPALGGGGGGGAGGQTRITSIFSILAPDAVDVTPAIAKTFTVTVSAAEGKNLTGVKVFIEGVPGDWEIAVSPSSADIAVGSSQIFSVTVTAPSSQKSEIIYATAKASTNDGVSASKNIQFVVSAAPIVSNATEVSATSNATVVAGPKGPTGLFLGLETTTWAGIITGIASLAGGFYFLRKYRLLPKKNKISENKEKVAKEEKIESSVAEQPTNAEEADKPSEEKNSDAEKAD